MVSGASGSSYALGASNSLASDWGGGEGLWMNCVDATGFAGLAFWIRGSAPTGTVRLSLAMEDTTPPDAGDPALGGTCDSGCEAPYGDVVVTDTWTLVELPWTWFAPGSANGSAVPATGDDLTGVNFSVSIPWVENPPGSGTWVSDPAPYEIVIDDLRFLDSGGCPAGELLCSSTCVDVSTSTAHCGWCNNACGNGQLCSAGVCTCPGGLPICDGTCTDTSNDDANCGGCGNRCTGSRTCIDALCVCPPGTTDCDGECVDTGSDPDHCGACGYQCASGGCAGGVCQTGACTPGMIEEGRTCGAYDQIPMGKYWVNNNVWGASGATGSQCIWRTCLAGETIGWGTDWTWSGASSQVKSYASVVLGWHWGWETSGTGLPVRLSSGAAVNCDWSFSVNQNGTMNVAYDLWAHQIPNPDWGDDPSDEIMIWLYRAGGAGPIGARQTTVSLEGAQWDLHRGSNGYWNVYSYVRTTNATAADLNLRTFLQDLVSRGWLDSTQYLSSVEAGTEVFVGSGQLDTHSYSCAIQ